MSEVLLHMGCAVHRCAYTLDIVERVQLRAQAAVYAQELLVHDSGQRQRTEGIHAGIIDSLGVLVLAFQLESEVVGQMPALVVSAEQPKGVGIPDLESPQVQN